MMRKYQVRFGGGRMEKDAVGYPFLPTHDGLTNPDASRTSPAAYPTWNCVHASGHCWPTPTACMIQPITTTASCSACTG